MIKRQIDLISKDSPLTKILGENSSINERIDASNKIFNKMARAAEDLKLALKASDLDHLIYSCLDALPSKPVVVIPTPTPDKPKGKGHLKLVK